MGPDPASPFSCFFSWTQTLTPSVPCLWESRPLGLGQGCAACQPRCAAQWPRAPRWLSGYRPCPLAPLRSLEAEKPEAHGSR